MKSDRRDDAIALHFISITCHLSPAIYDDVWRSSSAFFPSRRQKKPPLWHSERQDCLV
ncbi:hypothetical protein H6G80_29155 [Nostoc sp. FACHB-87]|uniref:hypothetical protein n=1 Tax=Nostocaceae TaxID=1162 RepID=UPI00168A040A|nr:MULTISPECIES: hypothetical protein [Nostocaceae]MBD2458121.1 hypothetical protein [Nostoc sp. FACHB-87]MBD2479319.1 hypothetical protein [Anabaena sp. FACHB-83]